VRFARATASGHQLAWRRGLRAATAAACLAAAVAPSEALVAAPLALFITGVALTLLSRETLRWPGTRLLAAALLAGAAGAGSGLPSPWLDSLLIVAMLAALLDHHPLTAGQVGRRLAHLAAHDLLTKLPNRDTFVDRLKVALRNAADGRERLAVL